MALTVEEFGKLVFVAEASHPIPGGFVTRRRCHTEPRLIAIDHYNANNGKSSVSYEVDGRHSADIEQAWRWLALPAPEGAA